jgi:AraC family transcriptional regulator
MKTEHLFIKNMVCPRCIFTVEGILNKLDVAYNAVVLGEIELAEPISQEKSKAINTELRLVGFELIDNRMAVLIENIKKAVIHYIAEQNDAKKVNLSTYLSTRLNYEYTYLSHLFSVIEGVTIEQYYILQRIEKAKELLVYDQFTMSEIAYQIGFSSVHHLSAQFKKITGLTPSHFKKIGLSKRKSIDSL